MNLFIIETGGTIASKKEENTIDLAARPAFDYESLTNGSCSVTIRRPFYTLSENITPNHWLTLAKEVRKASDEDAEAVLITHGSDTLSYTAAALYYLCSDLDIPVVITAANRPADEPNSNAWANLTHSFELLMQVNRGIYVVWQNPDGVTRVYAPHRLMEADGDAFRSLGEPISSFKNNQFSPIPQEKLLTPCPLPEKIRHTVALIRPVPGLDYANVAWKEPPAAVLHTLYHSGTACAEGENTSFAIIKNRCRSENLPLYICPARKEADGAYASARVLAGAIPICDIAPEAAYVLLTLAYNQTAESPKTAVCRRSVERGENM